MDTARGVEIDRLRHDIDTTRASIAQMVGEVRQKVGEAMQWQTYVDRHPAPVLAAAALIGVVVGRRLARRIATSGPRLGPGQSFGPAATATWHRLGSRVEALVNRVIDEVADATDRPGRVLTVTMKYSPERKRVISGVKRVSKPGLRVYTKADKIPRVLGGLGVAVLSTSQGLMTDREARKRRMGGEILCFVW